MSEMLGNQYFMARNYSAAKDELEEALAKNPDSVTIKKKLIVCYTQTNMAELALSYFHELVSKDIRIIINTDAVKDDCPCPELVMQIESTKLNANDEVEKNVILGIIWLYCDINKSKEYLSKIPLTYPLSNMVRSILESMNSFLNTSIQSDQKVS